ncbi:MAG: mechanosensitive ion channel [Candidatus Melainabacteria bacterium]|nr:mechanosensitive ion channel [Candidatus Melainabacteria bacterium]
MTPTKRRRLLVPAAVSVLAALLLPLFLPLYLQLYWQLLSASPAAAQQEAGQSEPAGDDSPAAATWNGQQLFVYYATLDSLTPSQRAARTSRIIKSLVDDPDFEPGLVRLSETPQGTAIMYRDMTIATASIEDAKAAQSSTRQLAARFAAKLRGLFVEKKEELTAQQVAIGSSIAVGGLFILFLVIVLLFKTGSSTVSWLKGTKDRTLKDIKIQNATLVSSDMLVNSLISMVQLLQLVVFLAAVYTYLVVVLESFPTTRSMGITLKEMSTMPLASASEHFIDFLPNLFAIIIIGIITYGAIAFCRFVFDAMEAGTISISGFEREWSRPTYKLIRVLIILFFLILALPYCPGWESDSFKQVGLFFGLLFSLGSTSVVGHIMAGTVLTYTNAFKKGDRVMIGNCLGDVIEKSMFVTRLKTPKNEVISIPNAEILNSHVVNYSKMAQEGALILHTEVTIGYDVPWRKVNELLVRAAGQTEHILAEPEPFVLQRALTDFSITYELNAFTNDAGLMPRTYSGLHENILDQFNQEGLEIMSPRIFSIRDGNSLTIPRENLPDNYEPPAFRVDTGKKR